MPCDSADSGISSASWRLSSTYLCLPGNDGASVKPQLPITTEVTPCRPQALTSGFPKQLGVHVGVTVDETGCDHVPFGIDLSPPRSSMRPMLAIRSPEIPTSPRYRAPPDPSTTVPFRMIRS